MLIAISITKRLFVSYIASSPSHKMFAVKITLIGSKLIKGIRALVYQIAAKNGGFYSGDNKEESIRYVGNNLMVNILYPTAQGCLLFANDLDDNLRHYLLLKPENIQICGKFDEINLTSLPEGIFAKHYNTNDYDSENYSIAITRMTHITTRSTVDPETELLMIEDPLHEDFVGLECYRCHLMSQAPTEFPEEKDNPNNILWMSWPTHQRYDGLHTTEKHRVPQIAIKFVDAADQPETMDGGINRFKVTVAVECPDDNILAVMRNRIKPGLTVVEEEKKILTYVFVQDPKDFERCLMYKYHETKIIWTKKKYGTPVTAEEAHTLRRSSRLEAKKGLIAKVVGSPKKK